MGNVNGTHINKPGSFSELKTKPTKKLVLQHYKLLKIDVLHQMERSIREEPRFYLKERPAFDRYKKNLKGQHCISIHNIISYSCYTHINTLNIVIKMMFSSWMA